MLFTRTSGRPVTGALLFTMQKSENLSGCYRESIDKQKEAFAEAFRDIDWQADRLIMGLKSSSDFYANELGQIKLKELSNGHIVLLGDAGYCPSPFTGLGTNLCLVGSYILAGELARHGSRNISAALRSYGEKMRPFIDECQSISPTALSLFFPSSRLGIWVMHSLASAVASFSERFWQGQEELTDNHAERLPKYPELNLPL
jgi:2-polyprenyl-6-methoxyphenol hydroxylase-like FAD-dependent oxidoreductase